MHAPSFVQLVLTGLAATSTVASFGLTAPSGLALRHVGALVVLVAPALAAPGVSPSKADITIRSPRSEEKEEGSDLEARDPQRKRRRRKGGRKANRKANRKAKRRDSGVTAFGRRDTSEHSTGNENPEIGIRELADDSEASEVAAQSTEEEKTASNLESRDPQRKRRRRKGGRKANRKANRKAKRRDSGATAVDRRDVSADSDDSEVAARSTEEVDAVDIEARDFTALHHDGGAHAEEADAAEVEARDFSALHHDGGAHAEEGDAAEVEAREFTALHHDGGAHAEEADALEIEARDFTALHHDGGAHAEEADAADVEARDFTALHHGEEVDAADIEAREAFAFDHDEDEAA